MENKNQYTPGPWGIEIQDDEHTKYSPTARITSETRDGKGVAMIHLTSIGYSGDENDRATDEANARLIAAAPELLEALKRTDELFRVLFVKTPYGESPFAIGVPEGVMGRNAELIAKATGQPEQAEA